MERPFTQVDVFTDTLTQGNPLAVVHGADGLDDETMAAFARWTNLSETTFLCAPTDPAADYRVRIFTPTGELPFAGHPTLGSARAWLDAGGRPADESAVVQECGVGLVRVRRTGGRLAFAAPDLIRGGPVDPDEVSQIAEGLGLRSDQVLDAQWCDNGPGWVSLLLVDAQTVLGIDLGAATIGGRRIGVVGAHPAGSEAALEVRAFSRGFEDPATGSLNAALAQWLIPAGIAPPTYVAAQGTAVQRTGRIHVESDGDDIWVGGHTVLGISGSVALP